MLATSHAGVPDSTDDRAPRRLRSPVEWWLAQGLAASYVAPPEEPLPAELVDLLPGD